ncbi:autotransporter outer membrane beta-barrel domain-containing protein [Escherichia coli]
MGVKADKHRESNGTLVHSNGDGNVQTRLGVKTWLKSHHKMDDGNREFQPFVEVNWLHNSKDFSTSMDGVSVTQDGARNIAEIKTGVEGQRNANLNVWGMWAFRLPIGDIMTPLQWLALSGNSDLNNE